jgi:DNA repair photolyase
MRWQSLSIDLPVDSPSATLPLALPDAVVRTFDTPGFAGMTFYEIRAKSIISRVPAASRMPFEWTINPYRGCAHACVYCLDGDTQILMADGRTRALSDVGPGDAVYGTAVRGGSRRTVVTDVIGHWETIKPAYRITLDNDTTIIASSDHRFLTDRGWKYVTGHTNHRPYLTIGRRLVSLGGPLPGPVGPSPRIVSVESLHTALPMFDITTGTGDFIANGVVSHNCFARNTHTYLDLDSGADFDSKIVVKVNAPELLRKELRAASWRGDPIAMGTNVDCYQRAEGRYRLMPGIIAALRDAANPFSILTKSTLITRDLSVLREAARAADVRVSFSVGFLDEATWRSVEPGTPSPRRRLDAVRQFSDAGFRVSVLMAPILPGLTDTDESLDETVAAIVAAGACGVTPLALHLRPGAREWYTGWLARTHPGLVDQYRAIYRNGSYAPRAYQDALTARVTQAARRHGLNQREMDEHRRVAPGRSAERGARSGQAFQPALL